jgi:hypothetical protein
MMEAVRTSETSVDNQFTRQYNPEDSSEHHIFLHAFIHSLTHTHTHIHTHTYIVHTIHIYLRVRFPAGAKDFSSSLCVQTSSGAHPASCTVGTGVPFPGGKSAAGA